MEKLVELVAQIQGVFIAKDATSYHLVFVPKLGLKLAFMEHHCERNVNTQAQGSRKEARSKNLYYTISIACCCCYSEVGIYGDSEMDGERP
jgi:hypothetical protein